MKTLPRIRRSLTEVEHAVLWDRITASIHYMKEILPAFKKFHRRLRSRNVSLKDIVVEAMNTHDQIP